MPCRICGSVGNHRTYEAREMMIGLRDPFRYFLCAACGCLQIAEIPGSMAQYYPSAYYSFVHEPSADGRLMKWARRQRARYAVYNEGLIGKLIYEKAPNPALRSLWGLRITTDSSILDVGCGSGSVLYALQQIGFKNLLGIDPYIEGPTDHENGAPVLKRTIHDLTGQWDIIMFHHSFEHLVDPLATLRAASKLLSEEGLCIVRTPIVSSYAWKRYGVHWVQLDAPRHFFLHSLDSIALLSEQAGLIVENIVFDSTAMQFWGSEQYLRDIPLFSERSYVVNPSKAIFSRGEIDAYAKGARQLNLEQQGDQAAFYLRKR
ncbi:MAG: class I SAM-dependent methyltransferase [candidate division NC10 bacterium]|nr:class I SAM-dependent methyltransferase [candidate division NC10 bacterium]